MRQANPARVNRDLGGLAIPAGACDCHVHVFEPALFPLWTGRTYTPGRASLAMLEAHLDSLEMDRVVLVQASVYGADNSCLRDALTRLEGRGRGVAVIDPQTVTDAELQALRAAGVRGVRVNLESKGETRAGAALDAFARTANRLAGHGFAIQIYADLALLPGLCETIAACPSPVILDHFAGARTERGLSQPGLAELIDLLATGKVWVKLSAQYRASAQAGSEDLAPLARAMITARPDRMVWASDWPHTGGGKDRAARGPLAVEPFREIDSHAALHRLRSWCTDDAAFHRILAANAARLFDFPS